MKAICEYLMQASKVHSTQLNEYLLSKSKQKRSLNHEVITFEDEYDYKNNYDFDIQVSNLYPLLIHNAKKDRPGTSQYEEFEEISTNTINDENITIEGCTLLAIRCTVEGHSKLYGAKKTWWEVVKETAEIILDIFEYFYDDNVKIIEKGSRKYPLYYIIFPNNEVIETFCYKHMHEKLKNYQTK